MGITNHGYRFLLSRQQVDFTATATIGRQQLSLDRRDLEKIGADHIDPTGYADDLLRHLGASTVDSVDASDYEDATIVHDMNTPVPGKLHGRYTAVLDGGSLEHVFNFPTAIANCMNMVRPGGHLMLITPANNQLGHGFYQFSPELFFRVLSPQYGFEAPQVLVKDSRRHSGPWYDVQDPAAVGGRAEFGGGRALYLYVQARRTGDQPVDLSDPPQQSDYVTAWDDGDAYSGRFANLAGVRSVFSRVSRRYDPLMGIRGRHKADPRYFKKVTLPAVGEPRHQTRTSLRSDHERGHNA